MHRHLTIQFDPQNHSIYIYFQSIEAGEVAKTEQIDEGVLADLAKNGDLLGVELLGSEAVGKLFSRVSKEERLRPLDELIPKKELLERLIA